jgi:ABC-type antimicrobial peptide transport system ATPase subunit
MTYLFIVIAMSVMNALINKKITLAEMMFANIIIIGVTWGLEKVWLLRHESSKIVIYDNIELIQLGRRGELIADLQKRTGIRITRIEIGKIDFLKDTVLIKIHFYEDEQPGQLDESFSSTN